MRSMEPNVIADAVRTITVDLIAGSSAGPSNPAPVASFPPSRDTMARGAAPIKTKSNLMSSLGIRLSRKPCILPSLCGPAKRRRRWRDYMLMYETYGTLNADKSNAVLVCHALNASHHVAGDLRRPAEKHRLVGQYGRSGQAARYRQILRHRRLITSAPVSVPLARCTLNPATGKPYGAAFPVVTVEDWVAAQARLADALGIKQFAAVMGGSLGGMQALVVEHQLP